MPSKTDYLLIGAGALSAVLLTSYMPAFVKSMSSPSYIVKQGGCSKCSETAPLTPLTLDNIPGIDTVSLNTLRQQGLF